MYVLFLAGTWLCKRNELLGLIFVPLIVRNWLHVHSGNVYTSVAVWYAMPRCVCALCLLRACISTEASVVVLFLVQCQEISNLWCWVTAECFSCDCKIFCWLFVCVHVCLMCIFTCTHTCIRTHMSLQCKLELKPLEPVYQDVRVVIPQLETSMSVEYDQFSTVGDVLHQVLSQSDTPLDPSEGYSLYHVRLRLQ